MKNLKLIDAFEKELTLALNTTPPCNSSEENMLHDTIYTKELEIFGSRKKKPPDWFQANLDTWAQH